MDIVLDVNVYVDAVSELSGLQELPAALSGVKPSPELRFLVALSQGRVPGVRVHSGPHIWENVYRVLTAKLGWSPTDAKRWVAMCQQMTHASNGSGNVEVSLTKQQSLQMALHYQIELDSHTFCEDAHVVAIAQAVDAEYLVTADRDLRAAKVPGLQMLTLADLLVEIRKAA